MYNDKLVSKVVIWGFLGIVLWKEKEALNQPDFANSDSC